MFSESIQPTQSGQASFLCNAFQTTADTRDSFQTVPMNLSPEEIRAMVQDILG